MATTTHVRKWGNSLAVRLPQNILNQLQLAVDGEVSISVENGKIILEPVKRREYTLEELLAQCPPESIHDEIDFGKPRGKEVW